MKSIITPAIIIVALSTVAGFIFLKRHQAANELPAPKSIGIQLNDTTSSRRVDTLKQKNNSKIRIPKKGAENNKTASMVALINPETTDIPGVVEKKTHEMRNVDSTALIAYPEPAAIVELEQTPVEPDENTLTASITSSPLISEAGKKEASTKPRGKFFKFELFTPEGKVLPGVVHYVDIDRGVDIGAYKTDQYVDILGPRGKKPMTTVCEIFGYKEIVKAIDYTNPSATEKSAYQDEKGVWVIPYNLVPLEKGDVSIMNKVSFYKDAAIMLNDSKKDLNVLYNMMQANPAYVIKVHSYCNGKNKRLILVNNKDLFSPEGGTKYIGSAKDLTELRAEAIREYLANKGIDKNRIRIYPWGGRDMLVNEVSPNAKFNDRVEIEIMKD